MALASPCESFLTAWAKAGPERFRGQSRWDSERRNPAVSDPCPDGFHTAFAQRPDPAMQDVQKRCGQDLNGV